MNPVIKSFVDAVTSIAAVGKKTNADCRKEIRTVVGELADELERALDLSDSFLRGARFSKDNAELVSYLQATNNKLMSSFYEHHVCAGLYSLADRFKQVFDPVRFSVNISSYREIQNLIVTLSQGERAVLDDLQDMIRKLDDAAFKLHSATPDQQENQRLFVLSVVEAGRIEISGYRNEIKTLRRQIIDKM